MERFRHQIKGGASRNYSGRRKPTKAQLDFLRDLGWTKVTPDTRSEASDIIAVLKRRRDLARAGP